MILEIADSILEKNLMSEAEIRLELAVSLFEKNRMTLGQASELAKLDVEVFEIILRERAVLYPYFKKNAKQWQSLSLNIEQFPKDLTHFAVQSTQIAAIQSLFENEPSAEELCEML